jgi:GT2 family glycosyltransferase
LLEFSIIITTYNRKDLLKRAISSVLNQDYPGFELIIVDDNSNNENRLKTDEIKSDCVRYHQHEINYGVSAARNTGIKLAYHPYIVFLDDDDVFHENYLSKMAEHLKKYPDIDFAWCSKRNKVFENGYCIEEKDYFFSANSFTDTDVCPMLTYWANNLGVMIKKDVFDRIGMFDTKMSSGEDLDLLLRMLNAGMQFVSIPNVLIDVYIYKSKKSLSRQTTSQKESENLSRMIKKNEIFLIKNRQIWAYYTKSLIFAYYRAKNKKNARKQLFELMRHKPTKWPIIFRACKYELFIN